VLGSLPQSKVRTSVILNPTLTPSEFLEMAMIDFGILDIPESKAQRLWKLQAFLMKARQADQICALIVDEAHKLNPDYWKKSASWETSNTPMKKLLQILLIGQSELDEVLSRKELWQFTQRISVRLSIPPLSPRPPENTSPTVGRKPEDPRRTPSRRRPWRESRCCRRESPGSSIVFATMLLLLRSPTRPEGWR